METQDFAWALEQLRAGKIVCRSGWHREGLYIGLQPPEAYALAYLWLQVGRNRVPWTPSQTDLLSSDWALAVSA